MNNMLFSTLGSRFPVVILLLTIALPVFGVPGHDPGDGIIITGDPGAEGSLKISIKCKNADGSVEDIDVTVQINVATNDKDKEGQAGFGTVEADEKAEAIKDAIEALIPACFTVSHVLTSSEVILDVKDGAEIIELEVTDDSTKETIGKKITPRPPKKVNGNAGFEGTPQGGTASVSVGSVSATLDTTGMTPSHIMQDLAGQLSAQGVSAAFEGGVINITDDLSRLLLSAGNTDSGLTLSLGVSVIEPIPTVSEWGLIVMALILLTAGVIMIKKRRQVTA